jgi:hypothetical protein
LIKEEPIMFESPDSFEDLAQPDLAPLRGLAERAEIAEAVRELRNAFGYPLSDSDPLAPLAREIARSLTEAGFTLHHCDQRDPLYRLGGVCLIPIPAGFCAGPSGIAVSWTTHGLLVKDWDRYGVYRGTVEMMNVALGKVLHVFGYSVTELGTGGSWLVAGRRDPEAGADSSEIGPGVTSSAAPATRRGVGR